MAVMMTFFIPFILARIVLLFAVGMSDYGSMTIPRSFQLVFGFALLIPFFYTMWSVMKYFGMGRAMLGDHFRERYREMPLVKKGAFKYTSNAMYSFGFLGFWSLAFFCGSQAALGLALFQHAYIWVHMYCVEEPDMEIIHGEGSLQ
jgi:protein-S-isoprenylcysteine O-methyltransferase Ste14